MPLPSLVEPIRTERLVLRTVQPADLADLLAVNGDDEVTRFLPYASWQSLQDGEAWLARMQAMAESGGGRQLVLQRREDGRVIGTLLLFKHDQGSARAELGYALGRAHWGHGLMREAVSAACRHAFTALGLRRLEAEVNPDNLTSGRLLHAAGFVHEGRARQRWVAKGRAYDTDLYGCLAEEWLARPVAAATPGP